MPTTDLPTVAIVAGTVGAALLLLVLLAAIIFMLVWMHRRKNHETNRSSSVVRTTQALQPDFDAELDSNQAYTSYSEANNAWNVAQDQTEVDYVEIGPNQEGEAIQDQQAHSDTVEYIAVDTNQAYSTTDAILIDSRADAVYDVITAEEDDYDDVVIYY